MARKKMDDPFTEENAKKLRESYARMAESGENLVNHLWVISVYDITPAQLREAVLGGSCVAITLDGARLIGALVPEPWPSGEEDRSWWIGELGHPTHFFYVSFETLREMVEVLHDAGHIKFHYSFGRNKESLLKMLSSKK